MGFQKAILGWFSYNGSKRKDEDNYQVSKDSSAAEINPLLSLLHLPEWTLEIQFLSKLVTDYFVTYNNHDNT